MSYLSSDAPTDLTAHSHPTFQRGGQGETTGADLNAKGAHLGGQFITRAGFRQVCDPSCLRDYFRSQGQDFFPPGLPEVVVVSRQGEWKSQPVLVKQGAGKVNSAVASQVVAARQLAGTTYRGLKDSEGGLSIPSLC